MSIEGGGDSQNSSRLGKIEQAEFAEGAKVARHFMNLWTNVRAWFSLRDTEKRDTIGPLKPIEHYETWFRNVQCWDSQVVDELMEKSDPIAVAALDALADEFNANLDEILAKGRDEAMKYVNRAKQIIYQ